MAEVLSKTDIKKQLTDIFSHYSRDKSELIPILQEAQEKLGYLPAKAMEEIGEFLGIAGSTIYGVATFYALFKLVPSGKRIVRVCRGTACHVRGGAQILREIERRLGIKPGETTKDIEYTLETVACIGACALAPNITIGKDVHGQLTTKKIAEIFSDRKTAE